MAMSDAEVKRQIEHMVSFIKQEADEKAREILIKAEEEYEIEKTNIFNEEKAKIRALYERKQKQIETKKKIEHSNELGASRLRVLQARDDCIVQVREESKSRLASIANDKTKYKALLKDLIVQGLVRLEESNVAVRARKVDESLVSEVLSEAANLYKSKSGKDVKLALDKTANLPPPPGQSEVESCCGGVSLVAQDGRIVCSNTLDNRLEIAFEQLLPDIRIKLYGRSEGRKHLT